MTEAHGIPVQVRMAPPKMENKEIIEDIKQLCKDFKDYINRPKYSKKAGEWGLLFKKLNIILSKGRMA